MLMRWSTSKHFTPPVDVVELSDHIVILVEVAGMQPEDFNITLVNNTLVINGVRRRPPLKSKAYHRVEIGFGEFRLEIALPWSVQRDDVSATYRDGFLHVNLPRRAEQQIRIVDSEQTVKRDNEPDDE